MTPSGEMDRASTETSASEVQRFIKREQALLEAARRMRASAPNNSVRSQCDSQISEAARNVAYLQQRLRRLTMEEPTRRGGASNTGGANSDSNDLNGANDANAVARKDKPTARLDLFRWDRPLLTGARVKLMLQQLEYKTSIEQQYEQGTRKLVRLYEQTGDRRSAAEAHANLAESTSKMALLKRSKKRYSDMNLAAALGDDDDEPFVGDDVAPNVRRPLSGVLYVYVQQVEEVDHTIAWAEQVEMWLTMKVENSQVATTRTSHTSRFDEAFNISVDRSNEIEFTVYDRSASESGEANPVALLWLRISDIAEAIRQKRVERELKETGWASAAQIERQRDDSAPPESNSSSAAALNSTLASSVAPGTATQSTPDAPGAGNALSEDDSVEGWFTLEPAGRVYLKLGFDKANRKRPRMLDDRVDLARLGRHNAIRKREETQQVHGHEFVPHTAYNIVRCSVCGDFSTTYQQCQECQLACDRKCFSKIVTKCTALMSADPDEELNHRIPHQFEPTTNMKAAWCAQCGFILPLASRKNVRKCQECGIMCHTSCAAFVPDLCGMSMETAAQVVNEINSTRIRQATKAAAASLSASPKKHGKGHSHSSSLGSLYPYGRAPTALPHAPSVASRKTPVRRKPAPAMNTGPTEPSSDPAGKSSAPIGAPTGPSTGPSSGSALTGPLIGPPTGPPTGPSSGYPSGHQPGPTSGPTSGPTGLSSGPTTTGPAGPAGLIGPNSPNSPTGTGPNASSALAGTGPALTGTVGPIGRPSSPGTPSYASGPPSASSANFTTGPPLSQARDSPETSMSLPSSSTLTGPPLTSIGTGSQPPSGAAPGFNQGTSALRTSPGRSPAQTSPTHTPDRSPACSPNRHSRQDSHDESPQRNVDKERFAAGVAAALGSSVAASPSGPSVGAAGGAAGTAGGAMQGRRRRRKIGLDDFSFLAVLGKGNFGKVMLAESKQSGHLYAVKVLKKNYIIENREVESTRSEKRVFLIANRERHPFLTNLFACFQTENRIYFVMDYVSGGDLMFHIQQKMFSAKRAQFYAAEVLLALKHFHENDVIYRDLKLDNILLSPSGHIKVADYGLCKENMDFEKTTATFCGTPHFIAPEILHEQKYGRSVDWWALGVLMYQMLLGKSPFDTHGSDEEEVYAAILHDEPLYPIHMPRDSVSILQQLLTKEPTKRLGYGVRDAEEIMAHPYFANINFDDMLALKVDPPYRPEFSSPTDVRYFERDFTSEMPALTPMNSRLSPEMQEAFRGFSYSLEDTI